MVGIILPESKKIELTEEQMAVKSFVVNKKEWYFFSVHENPFKRHFYTFIYREWYVWLYDDDDLLVSMRIDDFCKQYHNEILEVNKKHF